VCVRAREHLSENNRYSNLEISNRHTYWFRRLARYNQNEYNRIIEVPDEM